MAEITSMQGQCGHKSEGDDEPDHSSIADDTLCLSSIAFFVHN